MKNLLKKYTYPFVETIRIENGRVRHIKYHNQRFNKTRRDLFNIPSSLDLREFITPPRVNGRSKCRILYRTEIEKIEYHAHSPKPIFSLKIMRDDLIEYAYKSTDRHAIKSLYDARGIRDDILIVRNGYLTDTRYGNIALEKDGIWYTPDTYLLPGTMRAYLLEKEKVSERKIHVDEIYHYDLLCIFNATTPFEEIILPTTQIFK